MIYTRMSEDNHEICIKMMSGDAFYEYGTNCACKLLSRVQGIDEGRGKQVEKKFANHQSTKCQRCEQRAEYVRNPNCMA
jgi:hypothetical protein